MFDFFEGLIENLGIKLISDFSDKLFDFIKETKNKSNKKLNDNGGEYAQIGSSGDYAQIGSSGEYAQIGSSGDLAKIGSSGYLAQIGSSGYYAQIGSSGDLAKIGSSGDYAQIGSSGEYAQIGSSGDLAKIGSSGYLAKIGSSGDYAQIGSSGDSAKIDILGDNGVGFACGFKSIIKSKKGTWISLCEYEKKSNGIIAPVYALSAQIGNKDYKDFKGMILKETEYYCLYNKQFYPVDISDGIKTIKISEKKRDNIIIIKGQDFDGSEVYIAKEKDLSAHGKTLQEALNDLQYKKIESKEVKEIVYEIKETGKVNRSQYRAITGACQFGTEQFCKQHNIQELEEIELKELRKILINDYGADKFWKLVDEN